MKRKRDVYNIICTNIELDSEVDALLDQLDTIQTYEELYTFRDDIRWKKVKRKRELRKQLKILRRSNHINVNMIQQIHEERKPQVTYKYHRQDHF